MIRTIRQKQNIIIFFLLLSVFFVFLLSFVGVPILSPTILFDDLSQTDTFIFYQIRFPRMLLAFLIGAALSMSGCSFQALLRNPLADPYILGISGGAALGSVLMMVAGVPLFLVPVGGFVFALGSLALVYSFASSKNGFSITSLLLIGIVFNAFSFALILLIHSFVDPSQTQQILYLMLGSIDPLSWNEIVILSSLVLASGFYFGIKSNVFNIMSLGDEEAHHLGVDVSREKKRIFIWTSLLVGASVSLSGLIGFVGLIVPHMTRALFGANHRFVFPASALVGGLLLMFCHFVSLILFHVHFIQTRLPVGAITALIGAPLFVYMLKRHQEGR